MWVARRGQPERASLAVRRADTALSEELKTMVSAAGESGSCGLALGPVEDKCVKAIRHGRKST